FLDRATTPPFWLSLLGVRLAAASVLGLIARLSQKLSPAFPLTVISVAVICSTIEAGVFATGGAHSAYRTSNRPALADSAILMPLGTLAGGLADELSTPLSWVSVELERLETDPLAASVRERVLAARAGTARMREVLIAMRQGARFAGGDLREVMLSHEVDLAL